MQAKVYPFPRRVQRLCSGCLIPLPRLAPAWHRHCRKCYAFGQYHRAVAVFLEATRPRQ